MTDDSPQSAEVEATPKGGGGGVPGAARPERGLRRAQEGTLVSLTLTGAWLFRDPNEVWEELRAALDLAPGEGAGEQGSAHAGNFEVDLSEVARIDGGTLALLLELAHEVRTGGGKVELTGASGTTQELLALYDQERVEALNPEPGEQPMLVQVGQATRELVGETKSALGFLGGLLRALRDAVRTPSSVNWRGVAPLAERAGADGLPIILLIGFLVGFIMAFQGAIQLKQFGANIFVADLVALTVTRELGPLMTAIIVAGRSGAAFAAELGTMKVSEEIDALTVLGLDPLRHLVLPRLFALVLVVPVLTLTADFMGIVGGLLVGMFSLDLTPVAYLSKTQGALELWDVFSGVLKSVAFAASISLVACQQGLATSGGAEGVGRRTTRAVVAILFFLILIDAGFAIVFNVFES